jgi:hypothetical protein
MDKGKIEVGGDEELQEKPPPKMIGIEPIEGRDSFQSSTSLALEVFPDDSTFCFFFF